MLRPIPNANCRRVVAAALGWLAAALPHFL